MWPSKQAVVALKQWIDCLNDYQRIFIYDKPEISAHLSKILKIDFDRTSKLRHLILATKLMIEELALLENGCRNGKPYVFVLRGGLLFGTITPTKLRKSIGGYCIASHNRNMDIFKIKYRDYPPNTRDEGCLLMDMIINSGVTICGCINDIITKTGCDVHKTEIVALFAGEKGIKRIRSEYPDINIHVCMPYIPVGKDKLLENIEFDAGELVLNR